MGPTTFRWASQPGATQYQIRIQPNQASGPGFDLIIGDAGLVSQSQYTLLPPVMGVGNYVLLPGLAYSWQVRLTGSSLPLSASDDAWGPWSPPSLFTTPGAASTMISRVAPAVGSVETGSTATLQWQNTAPDIFYYELQASTDPNFGQTSAIAPVWWLLLHGGLSEPVNSWQTPTLAAGQTYYWRVRPRMQGNTGQASWSATWSFQTAPAVDASLQALVLQGINEIRLANNLGLLTEVAELNASAYSHSADMAAMNNMSHTGSDGSDPGDREVRAGYNWRTYGEIVAMGYRTAEAVIDGWMNSPGHRAIIVSPAMRDFGAGLAYSESGRPYWTVNFGKR